MTGRSPPRRTRTVRIDPHVHTVASYDGHTMPESLVTRAESVGLDGVVVTDHDTVEGARVVANIATDSDLLAIPGCEVSTADGHLLALGVDFAPDPGDPLSETAARVQAAGGLAVVPHPFQRSRHGASAASIQGVDAIEVYNAYTLTNYRNNQAARFAAERDLPALGASDAHRAMGVGRTATAVEIPADAPLTADTVLEAIRAGRTAAVGRRSSTWQYLAKVVDTAVVNTPSLF